jgi:pilus assembly protein CpaC
MNWASKVRIVILVLALMTLPAWLHVTAQTAVAPEGQTLHVLVGKSVIVNVQAPMSRVLSSNPAVVETLATSPSQVVVEGKAPGASSLILWDEGGHSQILDVVVDLDVAALRSAIQRAYPNDSVDVHADGGKLILSGTVSDPKMTEDLMKMAGTYSKDVVNSVTVPTVHDRQLMLEVKFAEVDRTALAQFGFNLFSTGATNTIGTVTTGQFGSFGQQKINDIVGSGHLPFSSEQNISQVLNLFLFRPDIHLGAVVQALQQKNVLQILAEPNLMALNGQKASFLAGGEFPFPVVQQGQNVGVVTIQFRPFGVRLDFGASIGKDDVIRLHVAPEVSTLDFANALTISGFTVPAISTRKAETEVELKDGQSFGIAGLIDHRVQAQLSKVPGLGDVPVLGQLFRSKNFNRSNSELLVLVTPHIVDPVRTPPPSPSIPKGPIPPLDEPKFDKGLPGTSGGSASGSQPAEMK